MSWGQRPSQVRERKRRLALLLVGLGLGLAAVAVQLASLQIFAGRELAALSDRNRTRIRTVAAPRGLLFDRTGRPLVENRPAFTLAVVPRDADNLPAVVERVASLLELPVAGLRARIARVRPDSPWPVRLVRGLTLAEVTRLEEWKLDLPGVTVDVEPQRAYSGTRFAAHLLGYVREVAEEEGPGRRRGDVAGQSGLERLYDEYLRGQDGAEQIEVDAQGRPIRVLQRREPIPGAHVRTTIDGRIQHVAEAALGERAGAIVVLDPRNGDLLALASAPAFPVARFAGSLDRDAWLALVRDPRHPFLNRVTQGIYPPGSILKLVVAAAALQGEVFTPFDRLPCPPAWRLGNRQYHNWSRRDRGMLTLYEAIKYSCNTFFYQLGLKVGAQRIANMATEFGLGSSTGSGLLGEKPGIVPSPAWKRKLLRERWHPGDTVSLSIGQGLITVTPLQVARLMAAVANGGTLWKPRLVSRIEAADGSTVKAEEPIVQRRVALAPVIYEFLRRAMWGVVNDGGTGRAAGIQGIDVAGKTATAQTREVRSAAERRAWRDDHAWFAGFAPAEDPRVVLVVLVERAGPGGREAAPIARDVFRAIFLERIAAVSLRD